MHKLLKTTLHFSLALVVVASMLNSAQIHAEENKDETSKETKKLNEPMDSKNSKVRYKNYAIIDGMQNHNIEYNAYQHVFINFFYGFISGAFIGGLGGLSQYDSANTTATDNNFLLFSSVGAGTGGALGVVFMISESIRGEKFVQGKRFFRNSWYGALFGTFIGAIGGGIAYTSTQSTDEIIQYTGYGALGGLALGWVLYFIAPEITVSKIQILPTADGMSFRSTTRF